MEKIKKKYPLNLSLLISKMEFVANTIKNDKGFTLIELLLATSLMSVVIAAAFSLFFFTSHAFTEGTINSDLQQNVRLAADFISREISTADNISLISSQEIKYTHYNDKNSYIIKKRNREIVQVINNTEAKVAYNIELLSFVIDNSILFIAIKGSEGKHAYQVDFAVHMRNL